MIVSLDVCGRFSVIVTQSNSFFNVQPNELILWRVPGYFSLDQSRNVHKKPFSCFERPVAGNVHHSNFWDEGEGAVAELVVWCQGKEFCWLRWKNLMVCGVSR